jgi:hypothetical protein
MGYKALMLRTDDTPKRDIERVAAVRKACDETPLIEGPSDVCSATVDTATSSFRRRPEPKWWAQARSRLRSTSE